MRMEKKKKVQHTLFVTVGDSLVNRLQLVKGKSCFYLMTNFGNEEACIIFKIALVFIKNDEGVLFRSCQCNFGERFFDRNVIKLPQIYPPHCV